jgi:hypothetical protein
VGVPGGGWGATRSHLRVACLMRTQGGRPGPPPPGYGPPPMGPPPGYRPSGMAPPPGPPRPPPCVPDCRLGYDCVAGQCVPACNPPCPAGLECNGHGAQALCAPPSSPSPPVDAPP